MERLPQEVLAAWSEHEPAVVLTTVAADGTPNSIYASCVELYQERNIVIADNYFCKTKANILRGTPAAVLFITKSGKAYQVKGQIEYHESGVFFDFMKSWNPTKHPGHAAAVLVPEQVYCGATELK